MLREELISNPSPRASSPAASVASKSPPLSADSWYEERDLRMRLAQFRHFTRIGRTDHQHQMRCSFHLPAARCATRRYNGAPSTSKS